MDRVQLGTLQLDLRATGEAALSNTATSTWFPLTTDFLDAGLLNNFSTSDDLVTLLAELLADPGIGFGADCQVAPPHLVVRCSLIPSDGHGGDWRKRPKKDRSRTLRRLFAALKHGWDGDGGGDWVLAKRVSTTRWTKLNSSPKIISGSASSTPASRLQSSQKHEIGPLCLLEMRIRILGSCEVMI